jgi:signal transduction histidine kinase
VSASAGVAVIGPTPGCPQVVADRLTELFNRRMRQVADIEVSLPVYLGTSIAEETVNISQEHQTMTCIVTAYDGRAVISELERERLRSIAAAAIRAFNHLSSLERSEYKTLAALQEAQEKQRLFSQVSHDMKSPLGVIQSVLQLLAKVPACAEHADLIAGASTSAIRSRELLDDLLQFATLSAKAVVLRPQWIDPVPIIQDELRRLSLIACQQHVKVSCCYPRGANNLIFFDPQTLRRILVNLVSNGLKFAKGKSVKVVFTPVSGGACHLEVHDTGVGIPPEGIARLFKPFSRLHPEFEGTGLGLSICQDLAQLSGCSLTVRSTVNVGTTFSLVIPRGKYRRVTRSEAEETRVTTCNSGQPTG